MEKSLDGGEVKDRGVMPGLMMGVKEDADLR